MKPGPNQFGLDGLLISENLAALPERGLARATLPLTIEDVERKGRALAQHATQQTAMPELLRSFVRADEPFTVFTERSLENVADSVERALAEFARGK